MDMAQRRAEEEGIINRGVRNLHSELIDELYRVMRNQDISRTTLADMVGDAKTMSARTFNPTTNITLKTIVKNAEALDCDVHIELVPKDRKRR